MSIDAGKEQGRLTTKPVIFEGNKKLVINAKAPKGFVAVEILTSAGKPLGGFTKADCDVFSGDTVRHTVTWQGKASLSKLAGKPLRLRFYLRDAKLFSFSFSK